jgi:hypothetical protein
VRLLGAVESVVAIKPDLITSWGEVDGLVKGQVLSFIAHEIDAVLASRVRAQRCGVVGRYRFALRPGRIVAHLVVLDCDRVRPSTAIPPMVQPVGVPPVAPSKLPLATRFVAAEAEPPATRLPRNAHAIADFLIEIPRMICSTMRVG